MPLHSPPQSLCRFTLNTILINISGSLTLYYYIHLHTIAVLYQFCLYNISHLLSVVSSGGIFFKPLTHDLIIQTVKMISEREKLSIPWKPFFCCHTIIYRATHHRTGSLCVVVWWGLNHGYLAASDSAQNKYSDAFTISWTRSTGTSEVAQLDLELKWKYFGKVLQAIHNKLRVDSVLIQSANEPEMIVDSKLLHGNFDFSDNCAVLSIIGALDSICKWYLSPVVGPVNGK